MLKQQKAQKKILIPKEAGNIPNTSTTNPNTKAGLQITEDIVKKALQVTRQREIDAKEKEERKDKTSASRQAKRDEAAGNMLLVQQMHDDDENWRVLLVTQLWSAVIGFGGKKPKKGRKADALSIIESYLSEGVTHSMGGGGDEDDESSSSDDSSSSSDDSSSSSSDSG